MLVNGSTATDGLSGSGNAIFDCEATSSGRMRSSPKRCQSTSPATIRINTVAATAIQRRVSSGLRLPEIAGVRANSVEANGLLDVLDALFAQKLEPIVQLPLDLIKCCSRNQDASGLSQSFQSRCDIHAVPVNILTFDDHIAKVYANAEFELFFLRQFGVALRHSPLDFDGAGDRVNNA